MLQRLLSQPGKANDGANSSKSSWSGHPARRSSLDLEPEPGSLGWDGRQWVSRWVPAVSLSRVEEHARATSAVGRADPVRRWDLVTVDRIRDLFMAWRDRWQQ